MTIGLDDYVFQLGDDGIPLNDDGSPFIDILTVIGLDSPQFRESIRDHEGTDGGFIDAEFEKGREIILTGVAYSDSGTLESYLDDVKENFAPVTTPIPFYLKAPGVDERLVFVKSRGARYDWTAARRLGVTDIQFLMFAEDPRIYSAELINTVFSYGGDSGIGLAFSFAFDVDFGGGATPGGGIISNNGNRPAPVEFIITGPVINPIIRNNTTGDTLLFFIELLTGETLTINTRDRTVYLNGNANRRSTLQVAQWILLQPGNNDIFYGALTGIGSTLEISYRHAWR